MCILTNQSVIAIHSGEYIHSFENVLLNIQKQNKNGWRASDTSDIIVNEKQSNFK